jgi:hypothetical protein
MKKVLVLDSKHSLYIYDASTEELELEAYKKIFEFNKDFSCYEDQEGWHKNGRQWYKEIEKGDFTHIKNFIIWRVICHAEYEKVEEYSVD